MENTMSVSVLVMGNLADVTVYNADLDPVLTRVVDTDDLPDFLVDIPSEAISYDFQ